MKVTIRKRLLEDHTTYHNELILITETAYESQLLDALGSSVGIDGLITEVKGQIRLADGYGEHYIRLERTE